MAAFEEPAVQALDAAGTADDSILVLGIGNLLWADEGFGVRAVQALHARWQWPAQVTLMDGGTQGLYLLGSLCAARRVVVLDAIDFGLAPGTLKVYRDAEVPAWSDAVMSLHQASFQELLSLARLKGAFPAAITLIGVQPVLLDDLGGSLTPEVAARVDEAVALAVAELAAWGVQGVPRQAAPDDTLSAAALDLPLYEQGRPDAALACRVGDARFLNQVHGTGETA
jgi:hydrogenase maturation protease